MKLDWVGPLVLSIEEVGRVPDQIPGIYLLHCFDCRNGVYPVLYAGKSVDLHCRLVQHLQTRSTNEDVLAARSLAGLYFSAAPVLEAALRHVAEAELISRLRPPFNRQVPRPAFALGLNLPPMEVNFDFENERRGVP